MKREKLVQFTRILLEFMFYSGILVIISLPFSLRALGESFMPIFLEYYWVMLFIFAIGGILALVILFHLKRIMKTVVEKNCFVKANVLSLRWMGLFSFLISLTFLIRLFFQTTPATFLIILTFFVAGLFCLVLAQVFAEAVRYKEENELTI